MEHAKNPNQTLAIMDDEELQDYQKIVAFRERQRLLVERARIAFEEAAFVERLADNEQARCWERICESHGLDPKGNYILHPTGRISPGTPPESI